MSRIEGNGIEKVEGWNQERSGPSAGGKETCHNVVAVLTDVVAMLTDIVAVLKNVVAVLKNVEAVLKNVMAALKNVMAARRNVGLVLMLAPLKKAVRGTLQHLVARTPATWVAFAKICGLTRTIRFSGFRPRSTCTGNMLQRSCEYGRKMLLPSVDNPCLLCSADFDDRPALLEHVRTVHGGLQRYTGMQCWR